MANLVRSIKLSAPAEEVWGRIGPFGALADWHPAIDRCTVEGEGVGAVRTLRIMGGAEVKERLEAQDDGARSATYAGVEIPLPVTDYRGTLTVAPEPDGGCTVTWQATFEPDGVPEEMATQMIAGVFDSGLDGLRSLFGG